MTMTAEPAFPQPKARALSATITCNLCKGDAFHVLFDISHRNIMAGDKLIFDGTEAPAAIECVACGELIALTNP